MKECAIHMPISIGLEKNSPIIPRVNSLLRRAIEGGLVSKWLSDAIRNFESSIESEPKEALMDLKKMYGAFVALAIGYTCSLIALFGEKLYWEFVVLKNPYYDKYALRQFYRKSTISPINES